MKVHQGGAPRELSFAWPETGQRLAGKSCIVTGAGSQSRGIGIGRAISILFARQGAHVALVDKDRERAAETLALLNGSQRARAVVIEGDVTLRAECERIVSEAVGAFGGVDVLINNVGVLGPPGTALDVDENEWDQAMKTNVGSMVLMARFAIPELAKRGSGSIVNMSSIAGTIGVFQSLLYPVSKGAVVPLTRAMASQHAADGVRVNCIAPGYVFTPMVSVGGMSQATREARRRASALSDEGDAWDVAYAALYLASDESRWVTGVVLPVDGGLRVRAPRRGHHD